MRNLAYVFYWITVVSYFSVVLAMIGDEVVEKNRWLKPVLWFIAIFIIVSSIGIGVYYWFSHQYPSSLGLTTDTGIVYWNRTDIIYLLTLIATLIAPIVLIWSLNGWKEQHNKEMSAQTVRDIVSKLCALHVYLLNINDDFLIGYGADQNEKAFEKVKELVQRNKDWSNLLKSQVPLIEILLNNKSLSEKVITLENQILAITLGEVKGSLYSNSSNLEAIVEKREIQIQIAKATLLNIFRELEIYYRA